MLGLSITHLSQRKHLTPLEWASWEQAGSRKEVTFLERNKIGLTPNSDLALFPPAKSHPEVVVTTVASREPLRAAVYAKKKLIPIVEKSYQGQVFHISGTETQFCN
jgi:hypothetical protein